MEFARFEEWERDGGTSEKVMCIRKSELLAKERDPLYNPAQYVLPNPRKQQQERKEREEENRMKTIDYGLNALRPFVEPDNYDSLKYTGKRFATLPPHNSPMATAPAPAPALQQHKQPKPPLISVSEPLQTSRPHPPIATPPVPARRTWPSEPMSTMPAPQQCVQARPRDMTAQEMLQGMKSLPPIDQTSARQQLVEAAQTSITTPTPQQRAQHLPSVASTTISNQSNQAELSTMAAQIPQPRSLPQQLGTSTLARQQVTPTRPKPMLQQRNWSAQSATTPSATTPQPRYQPSQPRETASSHDRGQAAQAAVMTPARPQQYPERAGATTEPTPVQRQTIATILHDQRRAVKAVATTPTPSQRNKPPQPATAKSSPHDRGQLVQTVATTSALPQSQLMRTAPPSYPIQPYRPKTPPSVWAKEKQSGEESEGRKDSVSPGVLAATTPPYQASAPPPPATPTDNQRQVSSDILQLVFDLKSLPTYERTGFPRRRELGAKRYRDHFYYSGLLRHSSTLHQYRNNRQLLSEAWWRFILGPPPSTKTAKTEKMEDVKVEE